MTHDPTVGPPLLSVQSWPVGQLFVALQQRHKEETTKTNKKDMKKQLKKSTL